jgi:hypothetical protein
MGENGGADADQGGDRHSNAHGHDAAAPLHLVLRSTV